MSVKAKENYKHQQIELPTNPSYHYTPGSTINITSTGMSTLNTTFTYGCFLFQKVTDLEEEQEEKEEESENQKFTYQNLIPENLNIKTPNFQTQQNPNLENSEIETLNFQIQYHQNNHNPDINNQQHLPLVIMINPVPPIDKQQQQLLQSLQQLQQLLQQLQQQLQQPNVNPMAYALIAKLEKFTGKEDNAQKAIIANGWNDARAIQAILYFFQDTANLWYQSLANKLQDFAAFKLAFLQYFSNNNSINWLANTFTTIKQEENKAVTTYLECFHRNLCQIQAIQADYFTAPQILNQFIRGLHSSILQHIRPIHSANLQAIVTNAKDFESTELEANHAQAINLVINGSFELDSKLKQFKNASSNTQEPKQKQSLTNIPPVTVMKDESLAAIFSFEIEKPTEISLFSGATLEKKPITAMYTNAKIDGQSIKLILNSGSAGSIITRWLMNQLGRQVDQATSAKIITADETTKTPIGEIDNLSIEINGITIPIKVLVMEATQYQALVGNDWLSKINTTLDWNTQELQLSQNG
ncbi:hypothetical protein G9A89_011582 [Geosiphon pyriformis]|nr:hypothetical protein G9A89_011582 [Geosiphon pyriformis]